MAQTAPGISGGAEAVTYNDEVVRKFVIAATFWGIVGFLVGVIIALQLA